MLLNISIKRDYVQLSSYVVQLLLVGLVALLALKLANWTWDYVAPVEVSPVFIGTTIAVTQIASSRDAKGILRDILNARLFGLYQKEIEKKVVTPTKVVRKTRLNYTLLGIMLDDEGQESQAIINVPGKPREKLFTVNQMLSSNVKLIEIYKDHVIFEQGGVSEALYFPDAKGLKGSISVDVFEPVTSVDLSTQRERIQALRTDPSRLYDFIQGELVSHGFKVSSGKDKPMFDLMGFQNGDIITSINGVKIDSPSVMLEVMDLLKNSDSLTISLLRKNQPHDLQIEL